MVACSVSNKNLPSLLQEQKAQALKHLRLRGAKCLGVDNCFFLDLRIGKIPISCSKKVGKIPTFTNWMKIVIFGKIPKFETNFCFYYSLIKLLNLSIFLLININVNSSSSILFSEKLRFTAPAIPIFVLNFIFIFRLLAPRSGKARKGAVLSHPLAPLSRSLVGGICVNPKFQLREVYS